MYACTVHAYMFTYVVYCLYSAHSHTSTILFLTCTYVAPVEVSEQHCVLLLLLEDNWPLPDPEKTSHDRETERP